MAKLGMTFIPSEIEDDGYVGGGPVPAGKYLMQLVKGEMVDIKGDKGQRLNMDFQILEGPYEGRHVFQSLNICHRDPEARSIPLKQLKRLCEACNLELVDDSDEILHIPFMGTVIVKKDAQYGDKNELSNYAPYGQQKASSAARQAAPRHEPTHHYGPSASQQRPLEQSRASQAETQAARSRGAGNGAATRTADDAPWR